jgi:hypothetical protein
MPWPQARSIIVAVLCLWVLNTNISRDFHAVRLRLVTAPLPAHKSVALPLTGVEQIREPFVVIVCRLRNGGATPTSVSVRIDNQPLRDISLSPGSAARVDLVWLRTRLPSAHHVDLVGTTDQWTVEYLEAANLHGFTRGVVNLAILPASQPFTAATRWSLLLCCVWAWLMYRNRLPLWPRWARRTHLVLSSAVVTLFALTAASAFVSPYRVVLSAQTFVLGLAVVSAPQIFHWVTFVLRLLPAAVIRALTTFPWFRAILAAGFGGYALLIWLHVGAYAGGSDSSGYLNSARLLNSGHVSVAISRVATLPPEIVPDDAYVPLGFRSVSPHAMVPTYPIGLPLSVAAAARVVGWEAAPDFTMFLHALLGVVMIFWLACECGLSHEVAALAALILASCPLYLSSSLSFMSDVPALVWTTLAVILALRSRQGSDRAAGLAGLTLAFAVFVRPTNLLALAPIAVCMDRSLRHWLWLILGAAPGAALLFAYNLSAYGDPFTTGYGDISGELSASYVLPTLRHYATWLPALLTPVCLLTLALPVLMRRRPQMVTMLLVWIGAYLGFYVFYSHTNETWWYLRFLLPAFPPLIVGALWVACVIVASWAPTSLARMTNGRLWAAGTTVAVLILMYNNAWSRRLDVLDTGVGERVYFETANWAKAHLPPDATILAMQLSGTFFYYTDFPVVRYDDFSDDGLLRLESTAAAHGMPLVAVLFPFERERLLASSTDSRVGRWRMIGEVRNVTIWRFSSPSALNATP